MQNTLVCSPLWSANPMPYVSGMSRMYTLYVPNVCLNRPSDLPLPCPEAPCERVLVHPSLSSHPCPPACVCVYANPSSTVALVPSLS